MAQISSSAGVKWFRESRHEDCTTGCSVTRGATETLLVQHEHCSEGCDLDAVRDARVKELVDTFHWLLEKYPEVIKIDDIREAISRSYLSVPQYTSPLLG